MGAERVGQPESGRQQCAVQKKHRCRLESEEGIMSIVSGWLGGRPQGWGRGVAGTSPDQGNQRGLPRGGDMGAGPRAINKISI